METISIALACTVLGAIISYLTFQRNKTKDTKEEIQGLTKLQEESKYVVKGVDEIRYNLRDMNKNMSDMNERLIRVEESCKQAHKRLDKLEGK